MHWYFWIGRVVHTANFAVARGRKILSTAIRHIKLTVKQPSCVWFVNHVTSAYLSMSPPKKKSEKWPRQQCSQIALFYCIEIYFSERLETGAKFTCYFELLSDSLRYHFNPFTPQFNSTFSQPSKGEMYK